MAEITDAVVERRARQLAEQDGKAWQLEYAPVKPPGAKIELKPVLDAEGQAQYLARAREQLAREADSA